MASSSRNKLRHPALGPPDDPAKPASARALRAVGHPTPGEDRAALPSPKRTGHWPISYRGIAGFAAGLDVLLIVGVGLLASTLYHAIVFGGPGPVERSLAVAVSVALFFVAVARLHKLYNPTQLLLWNIQASNVIWIWCATFFLLSGWLFVWKAGDDVSRGAVLSFWGFGLLLLLLVRMFWRFFLERALQRGTLRGRKIVMIVRNSSALATKFGANLGRYGYELMREFVIPGASAEAVEKELANAFAFVRGSEVEEILLVVRSVDIADLGPIAERLRILPIPVTWIADGATAELVRHPWYELGPAMAIETQRPPRSMGERALKRAIDVAGASFGLILLLPVLVIVAIAIKLDTPGPAFFGQTRRGFNGKPFKIFKFRSMTVLEDGEVIKQATKRDARVTRVGAWIRRTSIDEIPQLFNVLRGEMSLVGPRPHAAAHDDQFIQTVEDYAYRNHVKPGITGWAQVHGYRGETPTLEAIQRRVEFDRWYINNWSVWLDFSIMLRTLGQIARGQNVY